MKNIKKLKINHFILSLFAVTFLFACNSDDDGSPDCLIEGRWVVDADQPNTLYEFSNGLRYTIYNTSGSFGTIADAIPNPNDYSYDGDELVIDLNFGNFSRSVPAYTCDCNVVTLGSGKLIKEGTTDCN